MQTLTINNTSDKSTSNVIKEVVDTVRLSVVSTMGPNGKLAVISVGSSVKVTKDGVTVAKAIQFDDPRKELINKIITEAAIKTDRDCGDGTTTTILYTAEFFELFSKYNNFREQRFIEDCATKIIEALNNSVIDIDLDDPRLYQLALTSSNSDHELSKTVIDIYRASKSKYPTVELKEGVTLEDSVVVSDGLPIKMQFSDPSFSTGGNGTESAFTDFIPVVINDNIGNGNDPLPGLINLINKYGGNTTVTIVIIGRSIEQKINSSLIKHNAASPQSNRNVRFVGVSTNMGGSIGSLLMQDIATMLGTQSFQSLEDAALVAVSPVKETLTIGNTRSLLTNITPDIKEAIELRAQSIEKELSSYELSDRFSVRAGFNETRVRNLRGSLVTVYVGGETNSDVKERTDRYEDVVKAVKSALEHGVLPGVGSALIKAGWDSLHEVLIEVKNNPDKYVSNALDIIDDIANICCATYNYLMKQSDAGVNPIKWHQGAYGFEPHCVSLSTGVTGTPSELGIYDTALASITALKGGVQTAKILSNGSSIIISNKIGGVSIIQK